MPRGWERSILTSRMPPQGVLVRDRSSTRSAADTSVIGGIFTYYNNQALTAGDHYLIEERGTAEIMVRQPIGADTSLTLALLDSWESSDQIVVRAYDVAGILLGDVAASVDTQGVTFTYQQQVAGQNVSYYRLTVETALAVQLSNFSAIQEGSGVKISWQTVSELNNLGFNLYRNTTPTSPQPLNHSLIPSQGPGSGQGFAYHWVDNTVQTGVTYYYWVEDVDTNGTITQHGPVSVSTNAPTALTVEEMTQGQPKRLVLPLLALIILVGAMAVLGSRYGNFFGRAA